MTRILPYVLVFVPLVACRPSPPPPSVPDVLPAVVPEAQGSGVAAEGSGEAAMVDVPAADPDPPEAWPEVTHVSALGVAFSDAQVLAEADGLRLERRRWRHEESEGWAWHAHCALPCEAEVTGTTEVTTLEALVPHGRRPHVTINGGFYDTDRTPMGVVVASGQVVQPFTGRGGSGVFVVDADGPRVVHRDAYTDGVEHALQSIDRIIAGGERLVNSRNPRLAARSAVALSDDAVELVTLAADFAILGGPLDVELGATSFTGLPLWLWADYVLATTDAHDALNLDGGISTQMEAEVGGVRFSLRSAHGTPNAITVWGR